MATKRKMRDDKNSYRSEIIDNLKQDFSDNPIIKINLHSSHLAPRNIEVQAHEALPLFTTQLPLF